MKKVEKKLINIVIIVHAYFPILLKKKIENFKEF